MPTEVPEYIRIADVLYKRAPSSRRVRTALDARSMFTPLQDAVAALNKQLGTIPQAVAPEQQAVVQQQVAKLTGGLTNIIKGLMGAQPNFNKAQADLVALKPVMDETRKALTTEILKPLNPEGIDNIVQLLNTLPAVPAPAPTAPAPTAPAAPLTAPA